MGIFVNIIWSILLIVFFVLLIWLFENKIGNDHNFISFMICSVGVCILYTEEYLTSFESAIGWFGFWLLNLIFSGTIISSINMSLQLSCLGMFGLAMLPKFSYTWSSIIANAVLSKVGIIAEILLVIIFFVGIMCNDNKKQNSKENDLNNISQNSSDFEFASFYMKGYDESIHYSLYDSGNNWATLKDENGNMTTVYIWNEGDGSLKDDAGNIYRPL